VAADLCGDDGKHTTIKDFTKIAANHGEIGGAPLIVGRLMHLRHGRSMFISVEVDFLHCSKGSLGVEGGGAMPFATRGFILRPLWGNDHEASCWYGGCNQNLVCHRFIYSYENYFQ
jgi:hypothetical protein